MKHFCWCNLVHINGTAIPEGGEEERLQKCDIHPSSQVENARVALRAAECSATLTTRRSHVFVFRDGPKGLISVSAVYASAEDAMLPSFLSSVKPQFPSDPHPRMRSQINYSEFQILE